MKKIISALCILLTLFAFNTLATATDEVVIPYYFKNGTAADADEVNANFDAIAKFINEKLIVMYDYGTPVNTVKTFEHTASPTTLTDIITDDSKETWVYSDGRMIEHLKKNSVEGTLEIGRKEYVDGGLALDLKYVPPIIGVDISGPKEVGKIWGGAYIAEKSDGSQYGAEMVMFSILAIEDVTVPAGTFLNCTKVYHTTGTYDSVTWYAEGVGMVKRIGVEGLMELKGVE